MTYSKPVQQLVTEHEVITGVLEALEAVAGRNGAGEFPQAFYEQAVDFFATFADQCHHAKEETHLFPMLAACGIPRDGGPVAVMLGEHEEGRAHLGAVRDALKRTAKGDAGARETVRRKALAYADLLRQHIFKENNILFPMGDQFMSPENKELLVQKFHSAEHSLHPAGTHEKYLAIAAKLRATAGLTEAAPATRRGPEVRCGHCGSGS